MVHEGRSQYSTEDEEQPAAPLINDPSNKNSGSEGVGLSNAGLSQSRRQMLDLVNRLQTTGVQVDIDLPQIAVIGSQSAGKSSLIESISGITLPRAAGTCTRCPTECRLSRGAPNAAWQCRVTLRFTHDRDGQLLGQARNEDFGPIIFDKALVEERIRRAQRAILNPSTAKNHFLEGDDEDAETSELTFSSNVVSLAISGPGVADLSFCDLPGLIASVSSGRGTSNDIQLVESLVTSYIRKPSCIILLTVACETDFENQGAHRLAKQHDPEGKRTIGVLTKPDRIPMGEERGWISFIRNEREPLDNNWFAVKQPSSNDIKQNITWDEARRRENDFFSMTAPWNELDGVYQKYLRTGNLVDRCSGVLSDLISKRLPEIQEELERGIIATRQALEKLPPPPSADPINDIANLLHVFTSELGRHCVQGVPHHDGLLQAIQPAQLKFRKAIRDTAPEFVPFERDGVGKKTLPQPQFLENEEEYGEGDADMSGCTDRVMSAKGRTIYVDEVYQRAMQARTRELPGSIPFVVQQAYIKEIVAKWRMPALIYLESVQTLLSAYVKKLVAYHFESFGQGPLYTNISRNASTGQRRVSSGSLNSKPFRSPLINTTSPTTRRNSSLTSRRRESKSYAEAWPIISKLSMHMDVMTTMKSEGSRRFWRVSLKWGSLGRNRRTSTRFCPATRCSPRSTSWPTFERTSRSHTSGSPTTSLWRSITNLCRV